MLDFRLKVFCAVARNLSFTKASQELHITQPAISKHIQELEQEYGVLLFNRLNTGIELTDAGKMFLLHTQNILEQYRLLDFDMKLFSHLQEGELRIGATATVAQYILPSYLASFAEKFKQVQLSLVQDSVQNIEDAVADGCLDMGLVESSCGNPHLRYTPFLRDEWVLVAPAAGRWALLDVIMPADLISLPLVVGREELEILVGQLVEYGVEKSQLKVAMLLDGIEGIKRYIKQADCVALVSRQAVSDEINSGVLKVIDIEGIAMNRNIVFVRRHGEVAELSKDFIDYMREWYKASI